MKKTIIILLTILITLLVAGQSLATPDQFGRAADNPKGSVTTEFLGFRDSSPPRSLVISGLEDNYAQGSTIMISCWEEVKKECLGFGNPKIAMEFYTSDKDHQTSANYVGSSTINR